MHCMRELVLLVLCLGSGYGNINIRRGGWLNKVVQYHKEKFLDEFKKMAPFEIKASIVPRPEGYQDSKKWDYNSVIHLLVLIRSSEASAPVYRSLRRMLKPTRRLMMGYAESFKHFPSLANYSLNEMYYDFESIEDYASGPKQVDQKDKGVIVVSNPVEARLPSAQISIELLKEILINRAIAGRSMETTPHSTIAWPPKNFSVTKGRTTQKANQKEEGEATVDSTNEPEEQDGASDGSGPSSSLPITSSSTTTVAGPL